MKVRIHYAIVEEGQLPVLKLFKTGAEKAEFVFKYPEENPMHNYLMHGYRDLDLIDLEIID